jgi:hypothetical protein
MIIRLYIKQNYSNDNPPRILSGKMASMPELQTMWVASMWASFKNHYDNKYTQRP